MFNKIKKESEKDQKKQEEKPQEKPKMRQIIIETDGTNINIIKAEVAGNLELIAILQTIVNNLNQRK